MLRKVLPFLITLITLYIINVLTFGYGLSYPLVPAFVCVIVTYYFSGVLVGSAIAFVLSVYAVIFSPDLLSTIIVLTSFGTGLTPVLFYEMRVRKIETADKVLSMMQETHALSLSMMVNWPDWTESERFHFAEKTHTKLADALTISRGWRLLAQERRQERLDQEENNIKAKVDG